MSWFYTRPVTRDCWLVAEPSQVNSFLVSGTDAAVAIDTGLGIAPIRPVHESLTRLPLSVVNTHYHADHVGGNHEFTDIAIHEAGADAITQPIPPQLLREYMAFVHHLIVAGRAMRAIDVQFTHLLNEESMPRELPDGFDPDAWTIVPSRATRRLSDGDRIELGARSLTVLHTPGHSPDSICLLDERDGLLFAGDTVATGPIYGHFPDGDVATFARSTRRLAELVDDVSLVLVGHFGRPVAEPSILIELADGLERMLAGAAPLVPFHDLHLKPVRLARFDRVGITVPLDWEAEMSAGVKSRG
jgi:glyoxylase-like metal-dependent hydrolase (beta-lactamase superfamily II)